MRRRSYERYIPFEDKEKERRRINAKIYREQQKSLQKDLIKKLQVVTSERDDLRKEKAALNTRIEELLELYGKYHRGKLINL